jgi:signal peptidase I
MKKLLLDLLDIGKTIAIVIALAFLIRYFIFQPFVVEGFSMEPNFTDQEYLLINKVTYRFENPQRGNVIVFIAPNVTSIDYIKRIIGLPGEKVSIKNQNIYINDKLLEEKYLSPDIKTVVQNDKSTTMELTLGDDEFFVLGDNRDHSSDSRVFGPLPKKNIIGKAWFSVYPWQIFGLVKTPSY